MSYADQIRVEPNARNMRELIADGIEENKSIADGANSKSDNANNTANTANDRVNNIITNTPSGTTKDEELVDLRHSNITNKTFNTVGARADDFDSQMADNTKQITDNVSEITNITNGNGVFVEKFPRIAPEADDSARINRAIKYAKDNGYGNVVLANKTYNIVNPILLQNMINLIGQGIGATTLNHTGSSQCILYSDTKNYGLRSSITNLTITGTNNTSDSACGAEIQDTYGFFMFNVVIADYLGAGLKITDVNNWCEGTILLNVSFRYNKTNILFSATSPSTGSFAYTQFLNVSINLAGGQTGIDFGGLNPLPIGSKMYHATLNVRFWADGGDGITFIKLRDNIELIDNDYKLVGENYNATNVTGIDTSTNSQLYGKGTVYFWGDIGQKIAGQVRIIGEDYYRSLDNITGEDSNNNVYKAISSADSIDYGNILLGFYKNSKDSNAGGAFLSVRSHDNNGFKLIKVPDGSSVKDGTITFQVDENGWLYPSCDKGGSAIISGTGSPQGVVYAPKGSLYLQTDGTSTFAYVNGGDLSHNNYWKPLTQGS